MKCLRFKPLIWIINFDRTIVIKLSLLSYLARMVVSFTKYKFFICSVKNHCTSADLQQMQKGIIFNAYTYLKTFQVYIELFKWGVVCLFYRRTQLLIQSQFERTNLLSAWSACIVKRTKQTWIYRNTDYIRLHQHNPCIIIKDWHVGYVAMKVRKKQS